MKAESGVKVVIAGLGFGSEFIPIYKDLKGVESVGICARTASKVKEVGDQYDIPPEMRFTDFNDILKREDINTIHIVTPPQSHADLSVASLKAGKHTACTVPMALSVDDCKAVVKARKAADKVYMMMETVLYSREYLFVKDLVTSGRLGRVQFVRGSHQQDMGLEGWPEYWLGFPPMFYGTHAISPLVDINGTLVDSVVCHGSGRIDEDMIPRYNSPFAIETATFKLQDSDVRAEATRSLYSTVRQYRESFDCYGDKMAFEWEQIAEEGHVLFEGGESARRIHVPDTDPMLPEEIKKYTKREQIHDQDHVSFIQGAGHGGSHPHLVNEFVKAILEGRDSAVDAVKAANITSAGLCAHESAMNNGREVKVPDFGAF
ncbi:MAG: Gfo/Idh/MocA family oxidoreductase [Spirochaetales bacterium]|nr:Gfo/Idh/MocA family oxidoreductase [Spirochaetales bacterium]